MSIPRRQQPLVSVVTPVYNGVDYIAECIESVLNQTYGNWEYLIVDNCSTDGTLEIAQGYENRDPRLRVVTASEFVGQIENKTGPSARSRPAASTARFFTPTTGFFPSASRE
jgi:glycosyltransferase involved in cell wall biosynthesis